VSRPPSGTARAVEALLRDLGPHLRRGRPPAEPPASLPTGLEALDQMLGGGFPRGRLSEISGPPSSGRTPLALALLGRTTRAGEACAVMDAADGFDPVSAQTAGVVLERVLWARVPELRGALQGAARVLETPGFGLVLLNLTHGGLRAPAAAWTRLARSVAATRSALLLLSLERAAGTASELALELRAVGARFCGRPPLLEGLETEVHLVRHRSAPTGRRLRLQLRADLPA
jgi:hypothetical protein